MKTKRYFIILVFCLILKDLTAQPPGWEWAKSFGGHEQDEQHCATKDAYGNYYASGNFSGQTITLGNIVVNKVGAFSGGTDIFIVKFDSTGNTLWAKAGGGNTVDNGLDMVTDRAGNLYVTGFFSGLTCTFDSITLNTISNKSMFLLKYNSSGHLMWAKSPTGGIDNCGNSVTVDSTGNIYVTGYYKNSISFESTTYLNSGGKDIYIAKYNSNGAILWVKTLGQSLDEETSKVKTDRKGNVYVCGQFSSSTITWGGDTLQNSSLFKMDAFVFKLDSLGNSLNAFSFGGKLDEFVSDMAIDYSGNIGVTGGFRSDTLILGSRKFTCNGSGDTYILQFDSTGNKTWAAALGGLADDGGSNILFNNNGGLLVAVNFRSSSFTLGNSYIVNTSPYNITDDFCILNYDSTFQLSWWKKKTSGSHSDFCKSIFLDRKGEIFVAGSFYSDHISFDNTLIVNSYANITCDFFIAKLSCHTYSTKNIIACNNFISPSGIYNWTSSGTYMDTIPNAAGCDSVISINLTINTLSSSSSQTITACNNFISPSGIYNWTSSGTYTDTIPNAAGCDSVITINLTINTLSSSSTQTITACNNYISPSGIYNWTSSGVYMDTIPNAAACDSIITFDLTINNSSSSSQTVATCQYYISPSGNFIWSASGTYLDTIPNLAGCDSIITTQLSINDNESSLIQTGCDSIIVNAQKYKQSGVYTQVLTNSAGCDSVLNLNLTIINSKDSTLTQTACDSIVVNGQKYISSGTYLQTLTNAFGCDSVLTLILTINNSSDSTLSEITCSEFTLNGITYNSSGVYTQTLTTTSGCDSILTLNLTLNSTSNILSQTACDSIIINGQKYVSSGVYAQTFTNAAGCDSLLTLNLTINQGTILNSTTSACHSYFTNGTTFTQSGLYHLPFMNAFGCASVFNLNLTIFHADTAVILNSNILNANATSGSYQWIDCNNGNLAIAGATFNSYTATANGAFAVIVTQNLCTDTSSCYLITGLGIKENVRNTSIAIFPNPAKNEFSISSISTIIEIDIYNFLGEKIYTLYTNKKYENVNCKDFASGIYFLQITTSLGIENRKLLIEK